MLCALNALFIYVANYFFIMYQLLRLNWCCAVVMDDDLGGMWRNVLSICLEELKNYHKKHQSQYPVTSWNLTLMRSEWVTICYHCANVLIPHSGLRYCVMFLNVGFWTCCVGCWSCLLFDAATSLYGELGRIVSRLLYMYFSIPVICS
jgi:hypothetical protein